MYERFPCREWQLLRLVQVHDVRQKKHARLMERDKAKRDGEFEAFMSKLEEQMV